MAGQRIAPHVSPAQGLPAVLLWLLQIQTAGIALQWAGRASKSLPLTQHTRGARRASSHTAWLRQSGAQRSISQASWGQAAGRSWAPRSPAVQPGAAAPCPALCSQALLTLCKIKNLSCWFGVFLKNLPELFLTDLPHPSQRGQTSRPSLQPENIYQVLVSYLLICGQILISINWCKSQLNQMYWFSLCLHTWHTDQSPVRCRYFFLLERNVF